MSPTSNLSPAEQSIVDYFLRGCKPREAFRIGMEIEHLCIREEDGNRIPYDIMRRHYADRSEIAYTAMGRTAGVHVSLDYSDAEDWRRKLFRAMLLLTPITVALFANSPASNGVGRFQAFRPLTWLAMDPDQWELHLSSIFTPVRTNDHLEVRTIDMQNHDLLPAVLAFWCGLLYSPHSLSQLLDALSVIPDEATWRRLCLAACRGGLGGEDSLLNDLVTQTMRLVAEGLRDLG